VQREVAQHDALVGAELRDHMELGRANDEDAPRGVGLQQPGPLVGALAAQRGGIKAGGAFDRARESAARAIQDGEKKHRW